MDDNSTMELFWNEFADLPRQGPGSKESTLQAFSSIRNLPDRPVILDIGCGTGAQTLAIAEYNNKATVYAVDTHKLFLERLDSKTEKRNLGERITVRHGDMSNLEFPEKKFDLIWSEGAIYIMGVEKGLTQWRNYLKDNGYIAFTEVCWIKPDRPSELKQFWESEYPDIGTIEKNLEIIEECGYELVDHFVLPASCWLDDYYIPLEKSLEQLKIEHKNNKSFLDLVNSMEHEIEIFRKYSDYYSYVFFVTQAV